MAEFCLKCWNSINKKNYPPSKYIISKDLDLCEGCGKYTHVIKGERRYLNMLESRLHTYPMAIFYDFISFLRSMLILPYKIYKRKKRAKQKKQIIRQTKTVGYLPTVFVSYSNNYIRLLKRPKGIPQYLTKKLNEVGFS